MKGNVHFQKNILVLSLILFISSTLLAQTKEYGLWTALGTEKKLGKWELSVNTELRAKLNPQDVQRWSIDVKGSYSVIKPLKAGLGYKYIYFHDEKYADYQPRIRYTMFVQGKQKFGDFKITLREQIQRTIKDESDRIKESSNYDNYKINPEWIWRNRLAVAYNIPKCPVTPSIALESFYQLNNPNGNIFEQMRYDLSFKYKLNKRNIFEVYGLVDKEINVNDPKFLFVTGVEYTYSF